MTPLQQLRAVAFPFPRPLSGGHARSEPTPDQDPFSGSSLRPVEDRVGEGMEDPEARGPSRDQERRAIATMDLQAVVPVTAGADQAVGMQQGDQEIVTGLFVSKIRPREVHGCLRVETTLPVTP